MSGTATTSEHPDGNAPVWGDPQQDSLDNESYSAWDQPAEPNQWDNPAPPVTEPWGGSRPPAETNWPTEDASAQSDPQWFTNSAQAETAWDQPPSTPPPLAPREQIMQMQQPQASLDHSAQALIRDIPEPGVAKARYGWRSWFGLAPGQAELSEREDLARAQRPLVGAKTVVILNPKGGAGKTPVTLTLAGALGSARGGSVGAVDNNELRGTMPLRTLPNGCRENVRTFVDNIDALRNAMSTAEIQRYMRHQGDGQYDALVCATDARHEVTAEEYNAIHEVLSRVYQLTIVDTGNNEGATNWKAAVESADAIVVPVKRASVSTCVAASQMLEELQKTHSNLVRNAIIVFTDGPGPVNKDEFTRNRDYFGQRARAVIELPTDKHISAEGPIEHDRLAAQTRRAALRLAAAVSDVLAEPR